MVGAILGGILFNKSIWGWGFSINELFLLQAFLPFSTILTCWSMIEISSGSQPTPILLHICSVWSTLKLDPMWKATILVFMYSLLQMPNMAFKNFLVKGLGFENFELGLLLVGAVIFSWLGLVIFRDFFLGFSWRNVLILMTAVSTFCSLMQITLVYRWNQILGVPDLYFAICDEAIAILAEKTHLMATHIMYLTLISEGTCFLTFESMS